MIRLLEDTTGAGKADKSTVFAEFHDMADGIAAGVVVARETFTSPDIPNLWLLKDTKNSGRADVKKSLSYGYGVRYNFLGHDLHGPRFGPDGKLYFTIGDRGANIEKSVDGTQGAEHWIRAPSSAATPTDRASKSSPPGFAIRSHLRSTTTAISSPATTTPTTATPPAGSMSSKAATAVGASDINGITTPSAAGRG